MTRCGGLSMRTVSLSLLLVIASAVLAAPVPKAAKKKSDLELLEGRWEIVTLDTGGGLQVQTGDFATFTLTVKDGKLSTATKSSPGYTSLPFRIDESQSPKHLDIETPNQSMSCLYEVDGDTLRWCHPQPGQPRPTELKGGNGSYLFVWKRVKE
jgi:uncharacterized protein (TIGR03067 family)